MLPLILSNNKTRLRKDQNLCFVNATLQVLYSIEDVREIFTAADPTAFPPSWPLSKELSRIFHSAGTEEISASELRRILGSTSGRQYLASGGQQDMEEFLSTLLLELEKEIQDDDGLFTPILHEFWGKEVTAMKFLDTPDGKCNKCLLYPSMSEDKFLTVKLKVPCSNHSIFLSTLIANHFSESSDQMMLRCI